MALTYAFNNVLCGALNAVRDDDGQIFIVEGQLWQIMINYDKESL